MSLEATEQSPDHPADNGSVLDDLGAEVTGIAFPVSVCMAITVALVRLLHGDGEVQERVYIGEAIYGEKEGDSAGRKFGGSLLNALVFVAAITVMTFVIVILFKYGCVKIIYGYMGFSTFLIFFFMTGGILIDVAQTIDLHVDAITMALFLYNFGCVGSVILFFTPAPMLLKQVYLTWTGVVVAFIFSSISEWTTWVLLSAMAIYDLVAVLTPHGPLQMLVNMAIERDEDIPALVYEAREVRRPRRRARPAAAPAADEALAGVPLGAAADAPAVAAHCEGEAPVNVTVASGARAGPVGEGAEGRSWRARGVAGVAAALRGLAPRAGAAIGGLQHRAQRRRPPRPLAESSEGLELSAPPPRARMTTSRGGASEAGPTVESNENGDSLAASEPLVAHCAPSSAMAAAVEDVGAEGGAPRPPPAPAPPGANPEGDRGSPGCAICLHSAHAKSRCVHARRLRRRDLERDAAEVDDPYQLGIPAGVKLGLGDFIFYSVLVGRASLYDWMTVYACFISVISGLGITLWLLAVARKALPALPVSIALGIAFYFATRWALEPFIVPAFLHGANW